MQVHPDVSAAWVIRRTFPTCTMPQARQYRVTLPDGSRRCFAAADSVDAVRHAQRLGAFTALDERGPRDVRKEV